MTKPMLHTPTAGQIFHFVAESNEIEGIYRDPSEDELRVTAAFLKSPTFNLDGVVEAVRVFQPDAELRTRDGLNVRVGNHTPPPGGPAIGFGLVEQIDRLHTFDLHPFDIYANYEWLHPFTDGNGRSGRLIWFWYSLRFSERDAYLAANLAFLKSFHYQTLDWHGQLKAKLTARRG